MKRTHNYSTGLISAACATLLVLTLAGCGSNPAPATTGRGAAAAPAAGASAGTNSTMTAAVTNPVAVVQSHFDATPQAGRDPFFPGASRSPVAQETAPGLTAPIVSYLKLLGIRSGTARPMALINRTALAPGEEASVSILLSNQVNRAEIQKVKVRCLEIRRDSVLVSIAGEEGVKELRIAQAK
jgi:hypothetical protein